MDACGYEIVREGEEEVMRIECNACSYFPSLENNATCMMRTIDKLAEVPSVSRVVFIQRRNYSYDYYQTQLLVEIANLYNFLTKQKKILSLENLGNHEDVAQRHANIRYLLFGLLRSDPLGAYVETKRLLREVKITNEESAYTKLLEYIFTLLGKTQLVGLFKGKLAGYVTGNRELYSEVFKPTITPDFIYTRLMAKFPKEAEQIESYSIKDVDINIFKLHDEINFLYHVTPPEFKISEEEYKLLDLARTVLAEHKPREEEFLDPERMRKTFLNIGRDLLQELSESQNISIDYSKIQELNKILVRYTVGFGMLEVLLQDPKVQDIVINAPVGQTPIFIVHEDFGECRTNIVPAVPDVEGWATKFRLVSGRPLDEANPVLDTELNVPGARARAAIISNPLNPYGLAYALRRHRDAPWTLPLFIKNRMINSLTAGLLSFLIDGGRCILFAGTRSSGKTSMMIASMFEIMNKYRIITSEDTLEIPNEAFRKLGYNIQSMKMRSALTVGGTEVAADEAIRTSLRMGDSSLIVGEIRSTEAKALWEAMRIGALANVVAGTIHGANPYAVFDRVVNDLNVPRTSFKATDLIFISNPIKSPDGLHRWRRGLQLAEVRKHWEEDPVKEKGFVDLLLYDTKTDELKPTDDLINGDSEVIKEIAGNIREWAGNWDAVWENILLRAKIKQALVDYAEKIRNYELLEAPFVVKSNSMFHRICDEVTKELGGLDNKVIFEKWNEWMRKEAK